MVEGNENNTNEPDSGSSTPKRRGGLFGARRGGRGRTGQERAAVTGEVPVQASADEPSAADAAESGRAAGERATRSQADVSVEPDAVEASVDAEASRREVDDVDAAEPEPVASPIPATLTTTSLIFHAPPVLVPVRAARARGAPDERGRAAPVSRPTSRRACAAAPAAAAARRGARPPTSPRTPSSRCARPASPSSSPSRRRSRAPRASRRRSSAAVTAATPVAAAPSSPRPSSSPAASPSTARWSCAPRAAASRSACSRTACSSSTTSPRNQDASLIGNVYLGRVQNVLPSMEAAFVDIGRGRNAVLYSGEVDWDAAAENGEKNQPRRIELALKPGDRVLVQVTKDPVGHKGARLTSQVSLPGRYLVYVPNGSMNGISRKLPDTERARLKKILKEVLPDNVGVIVRTAAEGATEEQLTLDVNRLIAQWADICHPAREGAGSRAAALRARPAHQDRARRLQRGLPEDDHLGRRGARDDRALPPRRRPRPARARRGLHGRARRLRRVPHHASRSRRPSTARCGCPPAARSSSTAPRR